MVYERAQSQYELGLHYFLTGQEKAAERWIRYAARDRHPEAVSLFKLGTQMGFFFSDSFYIHKFSCEILATLVTPEPQDSMLEQLKILISQFIGVRQ